MVYGNNFAAAVRVGGKVLREQNGVVYLPFGSEYSIRLKNLFSRKASVKLSIDGEDVLDGRELVCHPNKPFDLERWILNDNLSKGPRFKFIEKTGEISEHRGERVDDGIIRIEYCFEVEKPIRKKIVEEHHHHHHDYGWPRWPRYYWDNSSLTVFGSSVRGLSGSSEDTPKATYTCNSSNEGHITCDSLGDSEPIMENNVLYCNSINDQGITVKGGESRQQLHTTSWFATEENSHVLCLQLRGKEGEAIVEKPLEVRTKVQCEVCGRSNKSNQKFCGNCGNNLAW